MPSGSKYDLFIGTGWNITLFSRPAAVLASDRKHCAALHGFSVFFFGSQNTCLWFLIIDRLKRYNVFLALRDLVSHRDLGFDSQK